ncbi:hypothetical protein ROHU_026650 [Labeo rohita]|uniref:Uncharacterized protein n=1 Tax=Labeo rohita TaxID=84645 RepID=A0A498MDA7_LABRO|nr:hypothetical protein ROHU_026650 [Labeo rohita]
MRVVGTPNPHPFKPQAFWNDLMLAERAQLASSTRLRLKDAGRGLLCIGTSDPLWRVGSCQKGKSSFRWHLFIQSDVSIHAL